MRRGALDEFAVRPNIIGTGAVAFLKLSLLVPPVHASAAIDAKASTLAMRRGLVLAVQAGESVLNLENSLDVPEQCARVAIAKILLVGCMQYEMMSY